MNRSLPAGSPTSMQLRLAQFFLVIAVISLIIFFTSWGEGTPLWLTCIAGSGTAALAILLFVRSYSIPAESQRFTTWRRWRSKPKK